MAATPKGNIPTIPVDQLHPDPEQPRSEITDSSIERLANSIKETGRLSYPVLYREDADTKKLIIVDGERRWRACQKLDWKEIPAIKFDGDYEAVALIGNIAREELTAMDEAIAVNKLKSKYEGKLTQVQLGHMLGKEDATISDILKLVELPEYIQDEAKKNEKWSRAKLLKLAKQPGKKAKKALFERMKKEILETKPPRGARTKMIEAAQKHINLLNERLAKIEADTKLTLDDKKVLKPFLKELSKAIKDMLDRL